MQVHLVDGTYELFRCFYGAPSRAGKDGQEVGAVTVLCGSLLSLLRERDTTHVAVAFDTVIESFRNRLFDGYKTGEGIDAALFSQFPLAEEATRALGLVTWSMIDFEADDALATGAHRFAAATNAKRGERVERVVLCTPDKDLAQRLGVAPAQVPDLLALMGDDADGIPGLPGFGAKTAAALVDRFGSLDAIPDDPLQWSGVRGAARLAATLRDHREEARLYRTLATLRTDAPQDESLEELRWRGPDLARLEALAATLRDARLVERAQQTVRAIA
jgi:5'-3' exonuclease